MTKSVQRVGVEERARSGRTVSRVAEPRTLLLRGSEECERALSQLKGLGIESLRCVLLRLDHDCVEWHLGQLNIGRCTRLQTTYDDEVKPVVMRLMLCVEAALLDTLRGTDAEDLQWIAECAAYEQKGGGGWTIGANVTAFTSAPGFLDRGVLLL